MKLCLLMFPNSLPKVSSYVVHTRSSKPLQACKFPLFHVASRLLSRCHTAQQGFSSMLAGWILDSMIHAIHGWVETANWMCSVKHQLKKQKLQLALWQFRSHRPPTGLLLVSCQLCHRFPIDFTSGACALKHELVPHA